MLELTQPQLQKWARCSTATFPLMFVFREKLSQVPPVPKYCNVMPPPLRIISLPHVVTLYNKLTGGEGGWCVSINTQPTWPQIYSCLIFCLLSFPASPIAPS
jgi:hypothetical protein